MSQTGREEEKAGFLKRLRHLWGNKRIELSDAQLAETEELMLRADFGVPMTQRIIQQLHRNDKDLAQVLVANLTEVEKPLQTDGANPFCILVVGCNGAGKTTSLAKLTAYYQRQGKKVHLAAGDTRRAAAIEQLEVWAKRLRVPITKKNPNSDSAAVIYEGLDAAIQEECDIYLADTAGRLPNNERELRALNKTVKALAKRAPAAPHEILLVLDASHGQNALFQARLFKQALSISGFVLTKLDSGAKGGVVFALANELRIPLRFIGVGEGLEDLRPFKAEDYVRDLLQLD